MTFENVVPPSHECPLPAVESYGAGTIWTCTECLKTYRLGTARGQDRFGVWTEKKVWYFAPNGKTPTSCMSVVVITGGIILALAIVGAIIAVAIGFFSIFIFK